MALQPAPEIKLTEKDSYPRRFTWEEIGLRTGRGQPQQERWLVIDRKVYDISQFYRRHPGGAQVISHHAGQDAASQAGYLQHDLSHYSVFRKPKWNHIIHKFVTGHLLGLSASWWKRMHVQHHAKPNCFLKDPDISTHSSLFTLGQVLSVELGMKKKKFMPCNQQHKYFFVTILPFLFPVYFRYFAFHKLIQRKDWEDLAWMLSFYIRFFLVYEPLLRVKSLLGYYLLLRVLESIWFVWVSFMSQIPMNIDYDKNLDWFSIQKMLVVVDFCKLSTTDQMMRGCKPNCFLFVMILLHILLLFG